MNMATTTCLVWFETPSFPLSWPTQNFAFCFAGLSSLKTLITYSRSFRILIKKPRVERMRRQL